MGMSTHIIGFRPSDDKWREMKAVWNACSKAKIKIPDKVYDFFNGEDPNDLAGIEVKIQDSGAVKEYWVDGQNGFEVDITKLPKELKIIRFYNSY